tara:strand:+ start:1366 stop:1587 length:222 start_codon:yes stop_codon:yes gene_type:complete
MRLNDLIIRLQQIQEVSGDLIVTTNSEHGSEDPEFLTGDMIEHGTSYNIHGKSICENILAIDRQVTLVHIGGY